MPAERFRHSRVPYLEAGCKLIVKCTEILQNLILPNIHVVPKKKTLDLLLRNVAVLVALARRQIGNLRRQRGRHLNQLEDNGLAVLPMNLLRDNSRNVIISQVVDLTSTKLNLQNEILQENDEIDKKLNEWKTT